MFVVIYRKLFYALSALLVIGSVAAMYFYSFNLGIDFKGGSILEVNYPKGRPAIEMIQSELGKLAVDPSIRATGDTGYIIRMKTLTEPERQSVMSALSVDSTVVMEQKRFDSIGPLLGAEAARRSLFSIGFVLLAIVCFIAFAFRQVSEPVSSWKYGVVAVIALIHDVIVPTGIFVVLGHFRGIEIDTLFVTALLVILGFSVHDTIVVFDRVRENLRINRRKDFAVIVGESISQTFTRSINTSLTVVLSLLVLYFVGGTATENFTLALLIGVIAGTYSSVFLGSPLLVTIERWQNKQSK